MDKQKQILTRDRLMSIICNDELVDHLIESGLIIPENAVVLTNEEFWALSNKFSKKELDEIVEFHKKKTRKETAEKFAQALENRLDCIDTILHEDNEEKYLSANELGELIDEIAKEITEGV